MSLNLIISSAGTNPRLALCGSYSITSQLIWDVIFFCGRHFNPARPHKK
jgi:hypothetical protein